MPSSSKRAGARRAIRVLLVDDHPAVRTALHDWLSSEQSLHIVGACHSAMDALARLAALSPDIVLLDANMPEMSGLEAAGLIKRRGPAIRVVIMSLDDASLVAAQGMDTVDGVLHKDQLTQEFSSLAQRLCRAGPSL